jgi:hypothetical protein
MPKAKPFAKVLIEDSRTFDPLEFLLRAQWHHFLPGADGGPDDALIDEVQKLVDLADPDMRVLCDSILLMRTAGVDVTTPEGLRAAIAAGRARVAAYGTKSRLTPDEARERAEEHARREEEQARDLERSACVYYARISDRCKIGYSTNLPNRMASLGVEELMATEAGGPRKERERHCQFADLRVHGEWFRYEGPLVEHVQRLANGWRSTPLSEKSDGC